MPSDLAARTLAQVMRNGVEMIGRGFDDTEDDWHPALAWIDQDGNTQIATLAEVANDKERLFGWVIPSILVGATAACITMAAWSVEGKDLREERVRPAHHSRRREQVHVYATADDGTTESWWMDVAYDEGGVRRPGEWHQYDVGVGPLVDAMTLRRQ